MFARHSAHNNPELISETSGMMPNFAGVEKFFAHDFQGAGAVGLFLSQAILHAPNPKRKSPGAGRRVNGGAVRL
jgi:hypothetical protein